VKPAVAATVKAEARKVIDGAAPGLRRYLT
jgi:hypothetical protein